MQSRHVVVIGGSIAGLGVALALSGRGHRVTVLEADATPLPNDHSEAFARWKRKGSPQTRHSHALLARLRNLLRDHAPDLLDKLLACGAQELRFTDRFRQLFPDAAAEDGDEDLVALACRRITFEWILRRHILDSGRVDFRDGVAVTRLEAQQRHGEAPVVEGVWVKTPEDGEQLLRGDLVVDASGRLTQLGRWLPAIGTPPVREESSPCGIYYTSRFYRLLDGVEPPALEGGIVGADLGYLKVGIFAGDSRVFSITLAASPTDTEMRRILQRPGFEAAVAAVPLAAQWTSPEVSAPVSDVHAMAKLTNARRWLVENDKPLALGFVAVGDSLIHTNPIVGRGCSLAWTAAFDLAACFDEHSEDLQALALAYDACVERNIAPWYTLQIAQDADAIEVAELQRRGADPYVATHPDGSHNGKNFLRAIIRDGLIPGLTEDPILLRILSRTLHLLDGPGEMLRNPIAMKAIMAAYERREQRAKVVLGPTRAEMLDRFAAVDVAA